MNIVNLYFALIKKALNGPFLFIQLIILNYFFAAEAAGAAGVAAGVAGVAVAAADSSDTAARVT